MHVPVTLHAPHIPLGLAWEWTQRFTIRRDWLTDWPTDWLPMAQSKLNFVLLDVRLLPLVPSGRCLDSRGQLKCDGTRAETRFRLSAKRTSPFKSAGGHQFSRLLAVEVCASAVVMLDTSCSEVVWRVLATHSIRQFSLHFPSRASPCAIRFQLDSSVRLGCVYSFSGAIYDRPHNQFQEYIHILYHVECLWNTMAQAQKPDFVSRRNGRVHLNRPVGVSSVDYSQPRCAHKR